VTGLAPGAAVAVVGAGTMGSGIAQVAAQAGHPVLLFDAREGAATAAIEAIVERLDRLVARQRLDLAARDAAAARLRPCRALDEVAPAQLVIEAIVEELEAKRRLLAALEGIVAADAILATNTSSLSITVIAAGLRRPER